MPGSSIQIDLAAVADTASDLGVQWSLSAPERELEANVVHLPAGAEIGEHVAGVDVAIVVVAGGGTAAIGGEPQDLQEGMLVFVPRGVDRSISAGARGITYLTVHRRRDDGLSIHPFAGRPSEGFASEREVPR